MGIPQRCPTESNRGVNPFCSSLLLAHITRREPSVLSVLVCLCSACSPCHVYFMIMFTLIYDLIFYILIFQLLFLFTVPLRILPCSCFSLFSPLITLLYAIHVLLPLLCITILCYFSRFSSCTSHFLILIRLTLLSLHRTLLLLVLFSFVVLALLFS